jgi:DNA repair protein RadC
MRHVHDNPGAGGDVDCVDSVDLLPSLMVKEANGQYRVAEYDEVFAVARNLADQRLMNRPFFAETETVKNFFFAKLGKCEREVFAVIFADTRHKLIAYEELFYGTIDGCEVRPREIVKAALRLNAATVFLAHNHPSGNPDPSAADRLLTKNLADALKLVDVRTLDHIVVGAGRCVSFAERGWL